MGIVNSLLSEDQLLCSICLEVFTDPVTTSCGHSFCCTCINKHWDTSEHCYCPLCKEEFSCRPVLKTNTCLSEMVSEFKRQSEDSAVQKELKEQVQCESSEPESGVLCDVCPDPKLQALKSCLMCQISYCPLHLQPHLTVPRLQKHQLITAVTDLEERVCTEHARPLELLCRDHSELICVLCSYTEHRDHNTVPLKEQCEEQQKHLQQEIQQRRDKVQEIQKSVQLSQKNADREMEEGVKFFKHLKKCVQQSLDQFKLSIKQKHEEIKTEAEELIKGLESDIFGLEQRRAEMEEIWRSDDHFQFVQTFTSAKPAPELQDWAQKSVRAPSYKGRVAKAVSELQITKLMPKIKKLSDDVFLQAKKYPVIVTLDPDTAHPNLFLSQDYKQVKYINQKINLPNNPERFSTLLYVLGKEKFSSGRFYFEVQVKGKTSWFLGVAEESVKRKVGCGDMTLKNGYGYLCGRQNNLPLWSAVEKVGVFVDYGQGLVYFFDAETSALIDSLTDCHFTENIVPLFSPGNNNFGNNSAPLILIPARV